MTEKPKSQPNAFGMALAARKGDVPPEALKGSAKLLFKDSTLSNEQLSDYATTKEPSTKKQFGQLRRTYKRG